jgi:hypothetical protein
VLCKFGRRAVIGLAAPDTPLCWWRAVNCGVVPEIIGVRNDGKEGRVGDSDGFPFVEMTNLGTLQVNPRTLPFLDGGPS